MPGHAEMGVLLFVPVVSRCCSALAVMKLKTMNTSQYANTTDYPKWHAWALVLVLIVSITISGVLWGIAFLALLGALAGYAIALRKSYRSLDGMNGDISGFCICISELCAVLVMVFL
jgi:adenosylcobinamide-GDP ribazoletransferase